MLKLPIDSTATRIARRRRHALATFGACCLWCHTVGAQTASPPSASDPPARAPAFKGNWQGPTKRVLPGPGPKPGQAVPEYLAGLTPGDRHPARLHVLVLGGSRGFHHDSVPAAMNAIYEAGKRTTLWDTEFATDFELLNSGGGAPMKFGFQPKGLGDFDAVVVANATGDWKLNDAQKAAFVAFVHDEGKGLVVIHAGLDANHGWHDYIDMVGGEFVEHPFNTLDKVVVSVALVNEAPGFPIVRHLPVKFRKQDEWYVIRNWSRGEANVLLRLDATKLDFSATPDLATQIPPDHDFPMAWTKRYGKGRVFASSFGHHIEAFDDPDITQLYAEATKWVLGLTDGDEQPHAPRN